MDPGPLIFRENARPIMARQNGGWTDFSPISINPQTVAKQLLALSVYDPDTKTRTPHTNADGVPQWAVQCLFVPFDDDDRHTPAVVPVKVYAKTKPVVTQMAPVGFVRMRVTLWVMDGGRHGMAYAADAVDARPLPGGDK